MVSRFCAALSLYRDAPAAILKAFAISIVIHLMMGLEFYLLGKALHESVMGLGEYLLATQLADVTAVLPITPGGLGVRDTMAQLLFQEFGAAPANVATAIPLIYSAILLFWGIAGAILYVAFPAAKPFSSTCHSPNTNP